MSHGNALFCVSILKMSWNDILSKKRDRENEGGKNVQNIDNNKRYYLREMERESKRER